MKIVIELTQKELHEQFYTMMRFFGERFVDEVYQIIKANTDDFIEEDGETIARVYVEKESEEKQYQKDFLAYLESQKKENEK